MSKSSKNTTSIESQLDSELSFLRAYLSKETTDTLQLEELIFNSILPCCNKIKELQRNINKDVTNKEITNEDKLSNFKNWLIKEIPNCGLYKYYDFNIGKEGYGLVSVVDIPSNIEFLNINESIMLSTETALNSKYSDFYKSDPLCIQNPSILLSLQLLIESNNINSYYYNYINILPKYPNIPLLYTIDQLKCLKNTSVYSSILYMIRNTCRHYCYLLVALSRSKIKIYFTLEKWLWSVSIVMSRQNKLGIKNNIDWIALIPAWDMANHRTNGFETYYSNEANVLVCTTNTDVKANESIYINYGARTNAKLFTYQGFINYDPSLSFKDVFSTIALTDSAIVSFDLSWNSNFLDKIFENLVHPFNRYCNNCVISNPQFKSEAESIELERLYKLRTFRIPICTNIPTSNSDPLVGMRKLLLSKRNIKSILSADLCVGGKGVEWTKAWEFCKIAVANKSELEVILRGTDDPKISGRLFQAATLFFAYCVEKQLSLLRSQRSDSLDILLDNQLDDSKSPIHALNSFYLLECHVLEQIAVQLHFTAAHEVDSPIVSNFK